jgi:hypothetical protein
VKEPIINQAAVMAVVNDIDGPVAAEMLTQAASFVLDAQESLSIPRPWGQGRHLGNPFMRTGDLRDSITTEGPKVDDGELVVYVVSDRLNEGTHYANYAQILLDGGENKYGPYGPFEFLSVAKNAELTY